MTTMHFFEVVSAEGNWGKFRVHRLEEERAWRSHDGLRFCASRWGRNHIEVFDMETGKGAFFQHGGRAIYDVKKAGIHVCVLFPVFLEWLYQQDLEKLEELPKLIEVEGVPMRMQGYNLPGTGVWDIFELPDREQSDVLRQAALVGVTRGPRLSD